MKLHLLNRASVVNKSLKVSHNVFPNFLRVWHYHPEFEITAIIQSTGTRFIGDSIEKFREGEVVLLGKNVPHMWLNDKVYFQENNALQAEAVAVHLKEDFLGTEFFSIPEMKPISVMLKQAGKGIKFYNLRNDIVEKIKNLIHFDAATRIFKVIEILHLLAIHKDYKVLSSSSFVSSFHKTENRRLDKIYEFVFERFNDGSINSGNDPISSSDVAKIVGMNKSAFSRYFKKIHRKSFTTYLNEIRIGYACKLLLENMDSITGIAYQSGFNNVSNFNRQFKKIHKVSPSSYLKIHKSK